MKRSPGPGGSRHVGQPQHHVALADALRRRLHHAPVHLVHGLVDARGVEEHHLGPGAVHHGQDAVAGRLGLVGDDRDLLADQAVHEGGLAHVGPADHRHEAGAEGDDPASLTPGSRPARAGSAPG